MIIAEYMYAFCYNSPSLFLNNTVVVYELGHLIIQRFFSIRPSVYMRQSDLWSLNVLGNECIVQLAEIEHRPL